MSVVKRFVCLANSRKLNGRCVAGREIVEGRLANWIRPISARQHEEVALHEQQYEDGNNLQVMDIADVALLAPKPTNHQQENWLLDPKRKLAKVGRANWADLEQLADLADPLWLNASSTYHGQFDRISFAEATELGSSLRLIRVESLTLSVFAPREAFGDTRRRVQGHFWYADTHYRLWVTDPCYEHAYRAKQDGNYEIGESFVTVSLGEPADDGYCYKLLAGIVERSKET